MASPSRSGSVARITRAAPSATRAQFGQHLALAPDGHVPGLEAGVHVHAELPLGQVAGRVPPRPSPRSRAQVLPDRPCLCRRLDDHQVSATAHHPPRREPVAGGSPRPPRPNPCHPRLRRPPRAGTAARASGATPPRAPTFPPGARAGADRFRRRSARRSASSALMRSQMRTVPAPRRSTRSGRVTHPPPGASTIPVAPASSSVSSASSFRNASSPRSRINVPGSEPVRSCMRWSKSTNFHPSRCARRAPTVDFPAAMKPTSTMRPKGRPRPWLTGRRIRTVGRNWPRRSVGPAPPGRPGRIPGCG